MRYTIIAGVVADPLRLGLSPQSLFVPDPDDPPPPSPIAAEPEQSEDAVPSLSPMHNYPGPYPSASLGANLAVVLELKNVSKVGVLGVKMMCEVQSPGGRYRLGEVVHGQEEKDLVASEKEPAAAGEEAEDEQRKEEATSPDEAGPSQTALPTAVEPELPPGDDVKLDVASEMKELGLHVLICSVAWETPDGRRTFQRFLKFNVSPPLPSALLICPLRVPLGYTTTCHQNPNLLLSSSQYRSRPNRQRIHLPRDFDAEHLVPGDDL